MNKIFLLLGASFLMLSCHRGKKDSKASTYHLRFNPPDSSTYRYHATNELIITVVGKDGTSATHKTSQFTVNYSISRDSNDILLEVTFGKIDFHQKNGLGAGEVDVADGPGPVREILRRMKTADFFARVHPKDLALTLGGIQELVNTAMESYYSEADLQQARDYWGSWAEQEFAWRNLDPLVWVSLDSARHPGDHWTDTSTNAEEINFSINKRFQFDGIKANMATFECRGQISNDKRGTWLSGKAVTGTLTGNEAGMCRVDTATGMPGEMEDLINVGGNVEIEGHKAHISILKKIRMVGGKVK